MTVQEELRFVIVGFPDVNGFFRGKALAAAEFKRVSASGWLPLTNLVLALDPVDAPIEELDAVGVASGAGDLHIRPALDTLRRIPWNPGWGICIGTPFWVDGNRCELETRGLLTRLVERAANEGFEIKAALEYEFRLSRIETGDYVTAGLSYSAVDAFSLSAFINAVEVQAGSMGIEVSAVHSEAGRGLVEINVAAQPPVRAADEAMLLKMCVQHTARLHRLQATFLAKPEVGEEGSSGHLHLSFWKDGENCFAPVSDRMELSPRAAGAIAGILGHMRSLAILYNPNLNSYKRLVPGFFAPVNASWGVDNRSAAVRAILSDCESSRLEVRLPGADANPYLVIGASVASGLEGIIDALRPPPPVEGDVTTAQPDEGERLPRTLEEALAAFKGDDAVPQMFGEEFCQYFAVTREWELRAWQRTVTQWECDRYGRTL